MKVRHSCGQQIALAIPQEDSIQQKKIKIGWQSGTKEFHCIRDKSWQMNMDPFNTP
jgi:hypothetical protein